MEHTETDSVVGHIIVESTAEVMAEQGPLKAVEQLNDLVSENVLDSEDIQEFVRAAGVTAVSEGLGDRELRREIVINLREHEIQQDRLRRQRIITRR